MFLSVFCLWSVCDALLLHLICNSSLFWTQGAKSRWCICCCEISRDVEQREQPERSSHWLWPLLTAARLSTAQNRWATGKCTHPAVKVHFSICRISKHWWRIQNAILMDKLTILNSHSLTYYFPYQVMYHNWWPSLQLKHDFNYDSNDVGLNYC